MEVKERSKERITVELDVADKRDIKAEASRRGESLTEYVLGILMQGHEERKAQADK